MKNTLFSIRFLLLLSLISYVSKAQLTTQTFTYTGSLQTFTVPACVSTITIEARGAQGGSVLQALMPAVRQQQSPLFPFIHCLL